MLLTKRWWRSERQTYKIMQKVKEKLKPKPT